MKYTFNSSFLKKFEKDISKMSFRLGVTGEHYADIMTKHEYGFGNIPARAPFGRTFSKSENLAKLGKSLEIAFKNNPSVEKVRVFVGQQAVNTVRKTIIYGKLPPPVTKFTLSRRKKNTDPEKTLYDTGGLLNSINFE